MGGLIIDGFGAEDKFKTIKYLGEYVCPLCNNSNSFTLDEVNRKIVVLFIPTVSYSTKYAIMCKKCQRGRYIDEVDKDKILNGDATVDFSTGELQIVDINGGGGNPAPIDAPSPTIGINNNINNSADSSPGNGPAQNMIVCPGCGKEIKAVGKFCNLCGTIITMPEPEPAPEPAPERLFCNQCGKELVAGSVFCNYCGNRLNSSRSDSSSDSISKSDVISRMADPMSNNSK